MIPISLTLKNFVSYADSKIDFTRFNVALIVGLYDGNSDIANGVGKSSIFDAIRFALYNKTRFSSRDKIVRRGQEKCEVEFVFEIKNQIYKVIRRINKSLSVSSVELLKKNGKKWELENCDTPTATTSKIVEIIGMNHDTFVNSVYFRQNDISGFASSSVGKRKNILKEVLQMSIWDDFYEAAKSKRKTLLSKIEYLEHRLDEISLIEGTKEKNIQELEKLNKKLGELKDNICLLEDELEKCISKIHEIELNFVRNKNVNKKDLNNKLSDISSKISNIEKLRLSLKEEIKTNNDIIAKASHDFFRLNKKLKILAVDVVKVKKHKYYDKVKSFVADDELPEITYDENELNDKKEKFRKYKSDFDILKSQLSQLVSLEPGKECPICLTNIENFHNVSERRKERKNSLKRMILKIKEKLSKLSSSIKNCESIIIEADKSATEFERTELIAAKLSSGKSEAERKNEEIRKKCTELFFELNELNSSKEKVLLLLQSNFTDDEKKMNDLLSRKEEIIDSLNNLRDDLIELSSEKGNIEGKLEEIDKKTCEKKILTEQKNRIVFDIEIYANLMKAFGKDGIQSIIMENITEDLKNYINFILESICHEPMRVEINTQKKTDSGWKEDFDIVIFMNGAEYNFDDLSGGEQVRISIAVRLAISQLLIRRVGSDIRFLLLDEVDQTLDAQGIDALAEAIFLLSKDFKIMIITHNEIMKEKFEYVVTVLKGKEGSIIKQEEFN